MVRFGPLLLFAALAVTPESTSAKRIFARGKHEHQQDLEQPIDFRRGQYHRKLEHSPRRLELAVVNSDEYAESVLTVHEPKPVRFSGHDHARITTILSTTKEMIDTARVLVQDERTLIQGKEMMEKANAMFVEVKDSILRDKKKHEEAVAASGGLRSMEGGAEEEHREMLGHKFADHDLKRAQMEEERGLDIARSIYETMVTFPQCVGNLIEDCLATINSEISGLGLSTIEVVVHEKRNDNQDGYNKVVIITNELADRVQGKAGDGIVSYPFPWNDVVRGARSLGVEGKWNCSGYTPDECCNLIKQGVPNKDLRGKEIECHIFVPFGGIGNPRRNDRVFVNLSPDGRVHEPPIVQ